jgi:indole-3-glycerol phosphate synthase
MKLSEELIPLIPNGKIIVAESGINNKETIVELNKIGVDAFLIGEHFMRQDDIYESVKAFKDV